jgi:transposase
VATSTSTATRATTASRVDLEEVKRLLEEMLVGAERGGEAIALVLGLLANLRDQNSRLELDRLRLLRKHLGQTSEKISTTQLDLLMSLLGGASTGETPSPSADPKDAAPNKDGDDDAPLKPGPTNLPRGKGKSGRKALPDHLQRIDVPHLIPAEDRPCPVCGAERVCIGHETSEVLQIIPAKFVVERHLREKLACNAPACNGGVDVAPVPEKVIPKGRPGTSLLAHVVISKYADHLPLNRQCKIYLREGVDLSISTLAEWVAAVHKIIAPLAERCAFYALAAHVLQADDTGIKVLERDAPGGIKRGHLWGYIGDATWAAFNYTPTWEKEGPQNFLRTRRGWLVADAYAGYDGLYKRSDAIVVEVACWAHGRRGFAELAQAGDVRAAPMIGLIAQLYKIESDATTDQVDPDERLRRRREHSTPITMQIGELCAQIINTTPPKDDLARAAGYLVNQWTALQRFLEDGRLPIDNTLVERALRPIAIGRKNYLFCGSDAGAERAASAYTLLGTCALVGVDPRAYLVDVLNKLELENWPMRRIDELLPPNWIKTAPPSARIAPRR